VNQELLPLSNERLGEGGTQTFVGDNISQLLKKCKG
jgi:hypothetical protein